MKYKNEAGICKQADELNVVHSIWNQIVFEKCDDDRLSQIITWGLALFCSN